jgi:hypothetical protein
VRRASLEPPRREKSQEKSANPQGKPNNTRVKRRLTFDLLPLHLEGAALGLDRLLKAPDGLTLLLEG